MRVRRFTASRRLYSANRRSAPGSPSWCARHSRTASRPQSPARCGGRPMPVAVSRSFRPPWWPRRAHRWRRSTCARGGRQVRKARRSTGTSKDRPLKVTRSFQPSASSGKRSRSRPARRMRGPRASRIPIAVSASPSVSTSRKAASSPNAPKSRQRSARGSIAASPSESPAASAARAVIIASRRRRSSPGESPTAGGAGKSSQQRTPAFQRRDSRNGPIPDAMRKDDRITGGAYGRGRRRRKVRRPQRGAEACGARAPSLRRRSPGVALSAPTRSATRRPPRRAGGTPRRTGGAPPSRRRRPRRASRAPA